MTPAAGGTIPAGTYDYAITAQSPAGETTASVVPGIAVAAGQKVTASFNAVCHAVAYNLYRSAAGANSWTQVGTLARSATAATDDGTNPIALTITDAGGGGHLQGAAGGQRRRARALRPEPELPAPASSPRASAPWPPTPRRPTPRPRPTSTARCSRRGRRSPRAPSRPSRATRATSTTTSPSRASSSTSTTGSTSRPANGGGCVPIAGVTTCRTTPATWTDYVTSENNVMFRHVMGNDPRPHFMHQSNLADYNPALPETDPNQGGILYPVIDGLLARYDAGDRPRERPARRADEQRRSPRRSPSSPRGRRTSPRARSRRGCRTASCTSRTSAARRWTSR